MLYAAVTDVIVRTSRHIQQEKFRPDILGKVLGIYAIIVHINVLLLITVLYSTGIGYALRLIFFRTNYLDNS
jgi:hypothetical protein